MDSKTDQIKADTPAYLNQNANSNKVVVDDDGGGDNDDDEDATKASNSKLVRFAFEEIVNWNERVKEKIELLN